MIKSLLLAPFSALIFICLGTSCHTTHKAVPSATNLLTHAWIRDFSGLDGCKLLIVLDDGKKLLVNQVLVKGFEMMAGQEVLIKYKTIKEAASVCGSESAVVDLEEVRIINDKPCQELNEALKGWVRTNINKDKPIEITRFFDHDKHSHYLFNCGVIRILYDCNGHEECRLEGKVMTDCVRLWMSYKMDKIIWTKESAPK